MTFCATALMFASCDGIEGDKEIELTGGQKQQTVHADDTEGESAISFTAKSDWAVDVTEKTSSRVNNTSWLRLLFDGEEKYSGEAGDYTLTIEIDPNLTGATRTATITIICGEDKITVTITQDAKTAEGKDPDNDDEQALVDALTSYEPDFVRLVESWTAMDNAYSTLSARERLMPNEYGNHETLELWDFWKDAYEVIQYSNTIIALVNTTDSKDQEEKERCKARAQMYRGAAYMFLATLFGEVPLSTNYKTPWTELPKVSTDDLSDFIHGCFDVAIEGTPWVGSEKLVNEGNQARFLKMIAAARMKDNQTTAMMIDQLLEHFALVTVDANGDGRLDAGDKNEESSLSLQAYLLSAEAFLALENMPKAIDWLNQIYQTGTIPPGSSHDELMTIINESWTGWDEGMKIINQVRWGNTEAWGYRALLPIPIQVLSANENLTQNPGWN